MNYKKFVVKLKNGNQNTFREGRMTLMLNLSLPAISQASFQGQNWHLLFSLFLVEVQDLLCLILQTSLYRPTFDPFHTTVLFLYPLNTSKNIWLSDVFRRYRSGTLVKKRVKEQEIV